jgi:PAS domain S-box-containing protein
MSTGGGGGSRLGDFLVAVLGTGGVMTLLNYLQTRWANRRAAAKEDRQDLVTGYANMAAGLQKQLSLNDEEWQGQIDRLIARMERDEQEYRKEIDSLRAQNRRCEIENASLRGELRLLSVSLHHARLGLGGMAGTWTDGYIVADHTGKILDVNSGVTLILHWEEEELIGRSIEMLMPVRYREGHRAGMRRLIESGKPPAPDKVLALHALTREGAEIPVNIQLTAWQVEGGAWRSGATIRRRYEPLVADGAPEGEGPAQQPVPVVVVEDRSKGQVAP